MGLENFYEISIAFCAVDFYSKKSFRGSDLRARASTAQAEK